MKRLIVLRGCPGSGKSTYAQRIKSKLKDLFGVSVVICSADDYFTKSGSYIFDQSKLNKAHEECREQTKRAMRNGIECVIVDNTNTTRRDLKPYIELAKEFEYDVVEKIFGLDIDVSELHVRNQHGVPREKIELMARKLADSVRNVEGQTIKKVNGILTVKIKR